MQARRDVRGNRFINKPVSEAELDQILDAGLMAPSVGFSQPWRFVVIREPKTKQVVADIFERENTSAAKLFENERQTQYQQLKLEGITAAPVNIAVYYKQAQGPILGQTSMPQAGEYSVVCAVQNMWLMARAMNIGIGWVSILDPLKVNRLLGADQSHKLVAYLCVGHVDAFYSQPELERLQWERRKAKASVVKREQLG